MNLVNLDIELYPKIQTREWLQHENEANQEIYENDELEPVEVYAFYAGLKTTHLAVFLYLLYAL